MMSTGHPKLPSDSPRNTMYPMDHGPAEAIGHRVGQDVYMEHIQRPIPTLNMGRFRMDTGIKNAIGWGHIST